MECEKKKRNAKFCAACPLGLYCLTDDKAVVHGKCEYCGHRGLFVLVEKREKFEKLGVSFDQTAVYLTEAWADTCHCCMLYTAGEFVPNVICPTCMKKRETRYKA